MSVPKTALGSCSSPAHKQHAESLSFSWALLPKTDHKKLGYPGSAVPPGLKAAKKLSRGTEEQTRITSFTLTVLCVQLPNGPEEGFCTEVTDEITTPFIAPDDRKLLQAVGETNPVCARLCGLWSPSRPRVNLPALMALIQQS